MKWKGSGMDIVFEISLVLIGYIIFMIYLLVDNWSCKVYLYWNIFNIDIIFGVDVIIFFEFLWIFVFVIMVNRFIFV